MTKQKTLSKFLILVLFIQAVHFPLPTTSQQTQTTPATTTTTTMSTTVVVKTTTQASSTSNTITKSSWASNDVVLEFDESDVQNLNLKLKWRYTNTADTSSSSSNTDNSTMSIPTRFVLLMETKRINFSTFLFDYSSPQLIDDEQVKFYSFTSNIRNIVWIIINFFKRFDYNFR